MYFSASIVLMILLFSTFLLFIFVFLSSIYLLQNPGILKVDQLLSTFCFLLLKKFHTKCHFAISLPTCPYIAQLTD
jgi:hypothetical protein